MAQISTVAVSRKNIPKGEVQNQARGISRSFTPTSFSANVTSGDNILICNLDKDARIIGASVSISGAVGLAGGFCQLRVTENSVSTPLTEPLSTTYAGTVGMTAATPSVDRRYTKTVELLVGGNSIDSTATGTIEVTIHHDFYKAAG